MIKRAVCFAVGLCGVLLVFSQGGANPIIHFKQRFLKPPSPEDIEKPTDSTRTLHLMIAGNVYQTEKHIEYCFDEGTGKYNFRDELKYIQPILSIGDIAIANLKTSFGNDAHNMFSSPDEFALALKYSGINAVMHANLHAANVDRAVYSRTRDLMNEFDIRYTGAFSDKFQRLGNYPLIINKKGFRIAILNYTDLVNQPEISKNYYINKIDRDQIEQDMHLARANKPDFTIVYFDWGAEQQDIPSYNQVDLARFCFQQGADLVVGTHPNVPMRLDYVNYYRDGQYKEGIVAYSLGNLIASNEDVKNRNGYLIDMELSKNNYTGAVSIGDWGVIPVYTYYDTLTVPGKTKVYSLPCSAVESGEILAGIPYIEKRRVINGAYSVRQLLGATADEIQYNLTEQFANNVMETIDLTKAAWNNRFNQKRPEQIKPSEAPVLAGNIKVGSNPPSLAKIYGTEEPISTDKNSVTEKSDNSSRYEEEKSKAEKLFIATAPVTPKKDTAEVAINVTLTLPDTANTLSNKTIEPTAMATPNTEKENIAATTPNGNKKAEAGDEKEETEVQKKVNQETKEEAVAPVKRNTEEIPDKAETVEKTTEKRETETEVKMKPKGAEDLKSDPHLKGEVKPIEGKSLKLVTDTFYRIQFYALKKYVPLDTNYYTHLKGFEVMEDTDGLFKYMLGKYKTYHECYQFWKSQMQPRYKESFIVKYIDGKRILE